MGPVADEALRRWSARPPTDEDPDGFVRFLRRYGGEFDDRGRRREICGNVAYRLVPEPFQAPADARCPWCSSPLWTALDGDTSDARFAAALAHTGWKGRLRVVTCFFCSTYASVFTQVTPDGAAAWSAFTTRPAHLDGRTFMREDPPAVRLVPGEERRGDYEGHDCEGGSTLGGSPGWVQDPDHPDCPACGKLTGVVLLVLGGLVAAQVDAALGSRTAPAAVPAERMVAGKAAPAAGPPDHTSIVLPADGPDLDRRRERLAAEAVASALAGRGRPRPQIGTAGLRHPFGSRRPPPMPRFCPRQSS